MTMQKKLLIYGNGYLAEMARYIFEYDGGIEVAGYCIEKHLKSGEKRFDGLTLHDFEAIEESFAPDEFEIFIAIGNNYLREEIFKKTKKKGYGLFTFIESSVLRYENLETGENVFITGTSGIQPFVTIGDNSFIIGSKIGHHSVIGKHCLLSDSHIAGGVTIGDRAFIGINAAVQQKVKIGINNIIGMGSTITEDTGDNEVYTTSGSTRKMDFSSERIRNSYL
jgi:sugar O-acyltransferase (sialic acid O-acetyltransferase NeuD family)